VYRPRVGQGRSNLLVSWCFLQVVWSKCCLMISLSTLHRTLFWECSWDQSWIWSMVGK